MTILYVATHIQSMQYPADSILITLELAQSQSCNYYECIAYIGSYYVLKHAPSAYAQDDA